MMMIRWLLQDAVVLRKFGLYIPLWFRSCYDMQSPKSKAPTAHLFFSNCCPSISTWEVAMPPQLTTKAAVASHFLRF